MTAYLRQTTTARSSGAVVELYDTHHPHNVFDSSSGRWVTICSHGSLVNHATLALARVRLICYRCGSIYSRTKIARYHHRWNRSDAERVRSASATTVAAQASP